MLQWASVSREYSLGHGPQTLCLGELQSLFTRLPKLNGSKE